MGVMSEHGFLRLTSDVTVVGTYQCTHTHTQVGKRCAEKPGAAFVGHLDPGRHTLKVAHWTMVMG